MIKTLPDWWFDFKKLLAECVCFFVGHRVGKTYLLVEHTDWLSKEMIKQVWIYCGRCDSQKRVQDLAKKDGKTTEEAWKESL